MNYSKRNSCIDANNLMLLSCQDERHVSLKKDMQQAGDLAFRIMPLVPCVKFKMDTSLFPFRVMRTKPG